MMRELDDLTLSELERLMAALDHFQTVNRQAIDAMQIENAAGKAAVDRGDFAAAEMASLRFHLFDDQIDAAHRALEETCADLAITVPWQALGIGR